MRGHITQRTKDNKTWSVVIELKKVKGKRQQKWYTVKGNKKDAEKFLTEKLRELDTGTFIDSKNINVRQYFNFWYEQHCLNNLSPTTYESYRRNLDNYILEELGHIRLEDLKPMHLQSFYTKCSRKGLSNKTILYFHRIIHCALKQAMKWQFIIRNVADCVDTPKPEKYKPLVLNNKEITELINAIYNTDIYIPVVIAIYTGMRRGEILGLTWNNIDLEQGTLKVVQALYPTKKGLIFSTPKTENSIRKISLPLTLINILKEYKIEQETIKNRLGDNYNNLNLVCSQTDGNPIHPTRLNHKFKDLLAENNLPPIRFHDLRHSHASLLLKEHVEPKVISERLGHSNINITLDIYSHVYEETNMEVANTFDEIVKIG